MIIGICNRVRLVSSALHDVLSTTAIAFFRRHVSASVLSLSLEVFNACIGVCVLLHGGPPVVSYPEYQVAQCIDYHSTLQGRFYLIL
jgi:hypothetical protein